MRVGLERSVSGESEPVAAALDTGKPAIGIHLKNGRRARTQGLGAKLAHGGGPGRVDSVRQPEGFFAIGGYERTARAAADIVVAGARVELLEECGALTATTARAARGRLEDDGDGVGPDVGATRCSIRDFRQANAEEAEAEQSAEPLDGAPAW